MKQNRIGSIRVYLSGPMQYTADDGVGWRQKLTPELIKVGIDPNNILDPLSTRTGKLSVQDENKRLKFYKETDNYEGVKEVSRTLIRHDLRMVDVSDCLVLGVESQNGEMPRTYGTVHEIIVAVEQHKPIFILSDLTWKEFPVWLIGLLPNPGCWAKTPQELAKMIYHDVEENIHKESKWVFLGNIS